MDDEGNVTFVTNNTELDFTNFGSGPGAVQVGLPIANYTSPGLFPVEDLRINLTSKVQFASNGFLVIGWANQQQPFFLNVTLPPPVVAASAPAAAMQAHKWADLEGAYLITPGLKVMQGQRSLGTAANHTVVHIRFLTDDAGNGKLRIQSATRQETFTFAPGPRGSCIACYTSREWLVADAGPVIIHLEYSGGIQSALYIEELTLTEDFPVVWKTFMSP